MDEIGACSNGDLTALEWVTLEYYIHQVNPANGLVADKTARGAPASIAAVGMALATAPFVVERGLLPRDEVARRVLTRLRFFRDSPQGTEPDATGYKGFYYHFLDMETGRRVWAVRALDHRLGVPARGHAGRRHLLRPRDGRRARDPHARRRALPPRRLALGAETAGRPSRTAGGRRAASSPTAGRATTRPCCSTCSASARRPTRCPRRATPPGPPPTSGRRIYDHEYLYSGPLFTHQLSHIWIDFRGIQDAFMRERGIDYFENSRRATYVQQRVRDPQPAGVRGLRRELLGASRRATGPAGRSAWSTASSGASSITSRAACPTGPTTARSPPGPWSPRCRSRRRSCCRRSSISTGMDLGMLRALRLQGDLQPDLPGRGGAAAAGCRPSTSGSTRGRSS